MKILRTGSEWLVEGGRWRVAGGGEGVLLRAAKSGPFQSTRTIQGVSLPHTTYRLPLGTPWMVQVVFLTWGSFWGLRLDPEELPKSGPSHAPWPPFGNPRPWRLSALVEDLVEDWQGDVS